MSGEQEQQRANAPPVLERLQKGIKMPVCVIMVGMAGSGKTTLLTQLQKSLYDKREKEGVANNNNINDTCPSSSVDETNDVPIGDNCNDDGIRPPAAYCVNLDPATLNVPYDVSIDIRDTVNYKEVMKQHNLGPNGAIMTSLNLFATKFDQVLAILEKRAYEHLEEEGQDQKDAENDNEKNNDSDNVSPKRSDDKVSETTTAATEKTTTTPQYDMGMDYILVDTPGQIEAFTWSASGSIISESLASAFPTVLCFVVDTVRCASSPNTFMSNMLYACSMFYRTRLPLVIVFNKNDIVPHDFAIEWMRDYEAFQRALDDAIENNAPGSSSMGFYGSLTRSLSMVLDEFYANFAQNCSCGVSAVTGDGIDDFWNVVQYAAKNDFAVDYVQDLKNRIEEQKAKKQAIARLDVRRLQRDMLKDSESEEE